MTAKIYTDAEIIKINEARPENPIIGENGCTYAIHAVKMFYGEVESDNEVQFVPTIEKATEVVAKRTQNVSHENSVSSVKYFYYYVERHIDL